MWYELAFVMSELRQDCKERWSADIFIEQRKWEGGWKNSIVLTLTRQGKNKTEEMVNEMG